MSISDKIPINKVQFRNPWYTPISPESIPKSFDEMIEWCDEFFSGDNFIKMFEEKERKNNAC